MWHRRGGDAQWSPNSTPRCPRQHTACGPVSSCSTSLSTHFSYPSIHQPYLHGRYTSFRYTHLYPIRTALLSLSLQFTAQSLVKKPEIRDKQKTSRTMDGEMDWIAARFLLSTILGVHPLVVLDDGGRDDEHFPVDVESDGGVVVPAAVEAPEGVAGGAVCAVCTEEVAAGQALVRLPCAHWYHAACIAPWLRIRTTCPTCRAEMPRQMRPQQIAEREMAGGRLRREASCTMLASTLPG